MAEKRMKNVIVVVEGGVLTPVRIPKGVKLVVRDLDVGAKDTYTSK